MTNEKTENGVMEAFSFRKGVVKISGRWVRFGPALEGAIKGLSVGDRVSYTVEDGFLKNIQKEQKEQPQAVSPRPAASAAPAKAQAPAPAPAEGKHQSSPFEDRNQSIERQVALKAAVELAGLYGYKSTKECLDVAASFAAWIRSASPGDVELPPNGHMAANAAGKAAGTPPSSYLRS